jgi:hypothetical protein
VAALAGATTLPKGMPFASTTLSAFDALLSPIHRVPSRFLAATRGFGYAPIHRQIGQFEADVTVVSFEGDLP